MVVELDRIRLLDAVASDEGQKVPAGSTGTVMLVVDGGGVVEFTEPFAALAMVQGPHMEIIASTGT